MTVTEYLADFRAQIEANPENYPTSAFVALAQFEALQLIVPVVERLIDVLESLPKQHGGVEG